MVNDEPKPIEIAEERRCEACGSSFGCGAKLKSCWCFDVTLAAGARAKISESYNACLCPVCLAKFAARAASKAATEEP